MRLTHIAVDLDAASGREAAWQWSRSVPAVDGSIRLAGLELELTRTAQGSGTRVDVALHNPTQTAVELHAVRYKVDAVPRVVLENGYQSWSPVAPRCLVDPTVAAVRSGVGQGHLARRTVVGRPCRHR